MSTLLMGLHIFVCVALVFLVLIQSGKDGGIGAMSGGGSSQSVFGSSGGANFFTKLTSVMAAVFMVTSIGLTLVKSGKRQSVFDTAAPSSPVAPDPAVVPTTAPVAPQTK